MAMNRVARESRNRRNGADTVDTVYQIAGSIRVLRAQRVLLDADLAELYGVTTKRLNEQIRRNKERFPADFMFRLTPAEYGALRSQNATLNIARGQHRKYLPYVFTEHGAIMAAAVLNSPRAVEISIYVVRAFVRLRELLSSNHELAEQFRQLEARLDETLTDHDEAIAAILSAIRVLMQPSPTERRGIGFTAGFDEGS
jgi:phage regulator Rha-like protein